MLSVRRRTALLLLILLSVCLRGQAAPPQSSLHYVYFKITDQSPVQIPAYTQGGSFPQELSVLGDITGIVSISKPFGILGSDFLNRVYRIAYTGEQDGPEITQRLTTLNFIAFAVEDEPVTPYFTPADPYYGSRQWALNKIRASSAWDVTLGNSNIVVAIVDDGLRFTHEDMSPVIWTNGSEIAGNGIDDDGNGYIDDMHGWDAADVDNDPAVPSSLAHYTFMDHGTACASAAGAATDNLKGVASIGAGISIMPVKIKRDADWNNLSLTNTYDGVTYAIAAHADVISLSWGAYIHPSNPLVSIYQAIIDAGNTAGITFVAAVGNTNNVGLGPNQPYPASLNYVIGVGSSSPTDLKSDFSNYGSIAGVDIMAPGEGIFVASAENDGAYRVVSGTSLACPLVAGACALILSANPSYTPSQVESCLLDAATEIDHLNPAYAGHLGSGRLDAELAVQCVTNNYTSFHILSSQQVCRNTSATFEADIFGTYQYYWTFGDGGSAGPLASHSVSHTYTSNGMYTVTLSIRHPFTGVEIYKATQENYVVVTDCNALNSANATWYFGNQAGVKFSTGRAVQDFNSTLSFADGSACISDASTNNILFYGGGTTGSDYLVNDASHSNINTSSGFGFMGSGAVQGGLILKKPGAANTYTIFVPSNYGSFGAADGFNRYDAIAGAANNPLTAVPIAGPPGCASNGAGAMISQHAITAVQACGSGEYWVIAMTNNGTSGVGEDLVVYKFTGTGLALTSTYTMPADIVVTSGLEASPDGNYLAFSYFNYSNENKTDVYRFDRTTGNISAFKVLDGGAMVLSFSPNSSLLYVDDNEDPFSVFTSIRQYDLKAVDPNASYQLISLGSSQVPAGLQLGPDNILYVNLYNTNVLAAIMYPDQKITAASLNACGYTPYVTELSNAAHPSVHSGSGLPNDVDATEFPIDYSYTISNCTDVQFTTPACGTYLWIFGDGTPNSTQRSPLHTYAPGTYTVRLITNGQLITKSITVGTAVNALIMPDDTRCNYVGGVKLLAQPTGTDYSYVWGYNGNPVTGYGEDYYFATAAGVYDVTVTDNRTGCVSNYHYNYTPGAVLQIQQPGIIFIGSNGVNLEVDPHTYPTFNTYTWYRNGVQVAGPCPCPQYFTSLPGDYEVKGENACGEQISLPYQLEMGPSCNPLLSPASYDYSYYGGYTFPAGSTSLGLPSPNPWYVLSGTNIIPSGATVIINDASLIMDPCAEIIVEPGGVLQMHRTNITSCYQWQGIKVLGTASMPRTSPTIPGTAHGQLYMNDCYLSDATIGVLADQGGYFDIQQTEFEGNNWHIGMQSYGFPSYNSATSCEFYRRTANGCSNSHFSASISGYLSHLFFDNCSEVTLTDNTFHGDYLVPVTPVVVGTGPLFSNMAIEYNNAGHMRAVQNRFYTNEGYGIYARQTGPLEVTSNLFEGRLPGTFTNNRMCGLYIFEGTNLLSYDNTYRYCYNGIEYYDYFGASSGIDHSLFEENLHGIVAAPQVNPLTNTSAAVNGIATPIGLGIHCNKFYNNMNGITGSGNLQDQGSPAVDASNMFSGNWQWNILWQQVTAPVNYYYGAYADPALTIGGGFMLNGSWETTTDVNSIGLFGPYSSCYMSWKNQPTAIAQSDAAGVKLYPNPNNGNFIVELPRKGDYDIRVTDIVGVTIYRAAVTGEQKKEIQLGSQFPAGNYSIVIKGEDVNYVQKFSVLK